jgi:ureidoglycolate amidohydrolase
LAGSEVLVEALKTTVDAQNRSFLDAAGSAEYAKDQDDLSSVFLKKGTYSAFVELHIEQGPLLEEEGRIISMPLLTLRTLFIYSKFPSIQFICIPGISIGIVTAIAAPASIKVGFEGNGGHAGAVLMPHR